MGSLELFRVSVSRRVWILPLLVVAAACRPQIFIKKSADPSKKEPSPPSAGADEKPDSALSSEVKKIVLDEINPWVSPDGSDTSKPPSIAVGLVLPNSSGVVGAGSTVIGKGLRPDGNTLYGVGSLTKAVTGFLLAQEVASASLKSSDKAHALLPAAVANFFPKTISLEQLVSHYSGFKAMPGNANPKEGVAKYLLSDLAGCFSSAKDCVPGASGSYLYSNLGIGLLGLALEQRFGAKNFDELLQAKLASKIGWVRTGTRDSPAFAKLSPSGNDPQVAFGYPEKPAPIAPPITEAKKIAYNQLLAQVNVRQEFAGMGVLASAGGLLSTPDDMIRFLKVLTGRSKEDHSRTLQQMKTLSLPGSAISGSNTNKRKIGYAVDSYTLNQFSGVGTCGTLSATDLVYAKPGNTPSHVAYLAWIPSRQVGLVVLANRAGFEGEIGCLSNRILQKILGRLSTSDYSPVRSGLPLAATSRATEAGSEASDAASLLQKASVKRTSAETNLAPQSSSVMPGLDVRPLPSSGALDWLVSDVCIDESGKATPEDPAFCPRKRNYALGEDILYALGGSRGGLTVASWPLYSGYTARAVTSFDRAPLRNGLVSPLVDRGGGRGLTGEETWIWPDSWGLFPACLLRSTCSATSSTLLTKGFTVWNFHQNFTYSDGKTLPTIVSHRFNASSRLDLSSRADKGTLAVEVLYFTKEYGLTRYETWASAPECRRLNPEARGLPDVCLAGNADSGCNGAAATQEWSSQGPPVVRTACDEATQHQRLQAPRHPFGDLADRSQITSRNLIQNSDFSAPGMGSWVSHGKLSTKIRSQRGNRYATVSCPRDGCRSGENLYQDASVSTESGSHFVYPRASLQSGVLLKASQEGALARVVTFVIRASGEYQTFEQLVKLGKEWAPVRYHFKRVFAPDDRALRLAIYPITPEVDIDVDEAFLATLPD
jgi:CubicO group peptidase (beta-lactamase class C family)